MSVPSAVFHSETSRLWIGLLLRVEETVAFAKNVFLFFFSLFLSIEADLAFLFVSYVFEGYIGPGKGSLYIQHTEALCLVPPG